MKDIYEFAYASRSKLAPKRHRPGQALGVNLSFPDVVSVMAVFAANPLQLSGTSCIPISAWRQG